MFTPIIAIGIALAAAWMVRDWIGVLIVAIAASVLTAVPFLLKQLRTTSEISPLSASLAPHLIARFAERVAEANRRLTEAKTSAANANTSLTAARNAANADLQNIGLNQAAQLAQQVADEANEVLEFEESQLAKLLNPSVLQGLLGRLSSASVLQYFIFGSLAFFVLYHLMTGITSSPPAGTTPRSMITLLISVVTVGIALILVLSTIVSQDNPERKERFSQGKEVLTALLGVLGTIVGFYFGTAEQSTNGLKFDPIVISMKDGGSSLSTLVSGGKGPYFFEASVTPAPAIPEPVRKTDGEINIPITAMPTLVSVLITATDSAGNTAKVEYKPVNVESEVKQ